MTKQLKIACVGESMIELSIDGVPGVGHVGVSGDTLNTAIYLRRSLDQIHHVSFVSKLGSDPLSEQMINFYRTEGLDTARIFRHPKLLPGLYAINLADDGERSFQYWRENSAARQLFQSDGHIDFKALAGLDVVYYSAISLAILPPTVRDAFLDWLVRFRSDGGRVAFDSNYRPKLWESQSAAQHYVERAWRSCDIGLPSVDDEIDLFGDDSLESVLDRFQSYQIPTGAMKCSASGPVALNREVAGNLDFKAAPVVVDTTAAGDSFSGAFLAAHLSGASLPAAMLAGHNCASNVVQFKGAIIPR